MPKLLSLNDRASFVGRLAEYAHHADLKRCNVIFHGGEPLLAGADSLVDFADQIRSGTSIQVDIGMQTNGLLLTKATVKKFEEANIAISLSLDGPQDANDKHRTSRSKRSSFKRALNALELLKIHPKIFSGVISVIDPTSSPLEILSFFNTHKPPSIDFLLPDANHIVPPPGRDAYPNIYKAWLTQAFDIWFDCFPHLRVRTFEALLDAVAGLPSTTDAFGLGDVNLISIETDGSYHDLDVLKITHHGATKIGGTVRETSVAAIAASVHIEAHRRLLTMEGLCSECRSCPVVNMCGGGSLPHRYGANGFDHPSIYCGEMIALLQNAKSRVTAMLCPSPVVSFGLPTNFDIERFERAEDAQEEMNFLCWEACNSLTQELLNIARGPTTEEHDYRVLFDKLICMDSKHLAQLSLQPGLVAWQKTYSATVAGRTVYSIDGTPIVAKADYLAQIMTRSKHEIESLAIAHHDSWLRMPFGETIYFEGQDHITQARPIVEQALAIIDTWRPRLGNEIRLACRAIQFVRDPLADSEKIVSFSDNSVPGALYVSIRQGNRFIDPYDLADSLIHEHRHQKLYLLERLAPTVEPTSHVVVSPWRDDLRPPSGLLHAIFVFVELKRFWTYVRESGPVQLHARAVNQILDTDNRLMSAFATLDTCPLTATGRKLTAVLRRTQANSGET